MRAKKSTSLFYGPDRDRLQKLNDQLLDKDSNLGSIISVERIRRSSRTIQLAFVQTIVNNGHGVARLSVPET